MCLVMSVDLNAIIIPYIFPFIFFTKFSLYTFYIKLKIIVFTILFHERVKFRSVTRNKMKFINTILFRTSEIISSWWIILSFRNIELFERKNFRNLGKSKQNLDCKYSFPIDL